MALEDDVIGLIEATNSLTDSLGTKLEDIDAKLEYVDAKLEYVDEYLIAHIGETDTDTIATLKAMVETPSTVYVTGYTTANDGAFGSHFFKWNSASVETDNGGTVIKLDGVTTGRYELQYDDAVNVKWFGAKGDGNTNDSVAIQQAVNSADKIVYTDGIFVQDSVTISSPIDIECIHATILLRAITDADRKPNGTNIDWTLAFPCFYLYSSDVNFIGCKFDLNNWNQVQDLVYRSDNPIAHRTLAAITSMDTDIDNFVMDRCEVSNGFSSGVVLAGGNNHTVINSNFHDLSTGAFLDGVAEPTVELSHWVNKLLFNENLIERMGAKLTEGEVKEYGAEDKPSVSADGILLRGENILISNSKFLNVDRSAIKIEQPKRNIAIVNVVSENTSSTGDKRYGRSIQFSTVSAGYEGTMAAPNNFMIDNCTAGECAMVGQIYGVKITNNRFNIPSAVASTFYSDILANIALTFNGPGQAGDISILGNSLSSSHEKQGIKLSSSGGGVYGVNIIANKFDAEHTEIFLASTVSTDGGFRFKDNDMTRSQAHTQAAILLNSQIFNGMHIIGNSNVYRIDARSGDPTLRLDMVIMGNVCTNNINVESTDVIVVNNVIKNPLGTRILDTAKKYPSDAYYQEQGGEYHVLTDLDTTPDVRGLKFVRANNSVATTISNFLNGTDGQEVSLFTTNGNTTMSNNGTMLTNGTALLSANSIITYVFYNGRWYEKSRSI